MPQQITVTSDEALDHMWAGYLKARADEDAAAKAEDSDQRHAETKRAEAALLREQVEAAEKEASIALNRSAEHSAQRTRAARMATELQGLVDEAVQVSNLQHPADRASAGLPAGVSALDGPLPAPLGATPLGGTPYPTPNGDRP